MFVSLVLSYFYLSIFIQVSHALYHVVCVCAYLLPLEYSITRMGALLFCSFMLTSSRRMPGMDQALGKWVWPGRLAKWLNRNCCREDAFCPEFCSNSRAPSDSDLFLKKFFELILAYVKVVKVVQRQIRYHLYVESKKSDVNELIYKTEVDSQT